MKKLSLIVCSLVLTCAAFAAPDIARLAGFKGYDCDTRDGKVTAWRDARPQPTPTDWQAIADEYTASQNTDDAKEKRAVSADLKTEALWALIVNGDSSKVEALKLKIAAAKAK